MQAIDKLVSLYQNSGKSETELQEGEWQMLWSSQVNFHCEKLIVCGNLTPGNYDKIRVLGPESVTYEIYFKLARKFDISSLLIELVKVKFIYIYDKVFVSC